ncbi:MAG: T9SS type A sorting domain-containing protein [Candidatus Eiseniibacteriota bacterium]|nr:MAG: T9SS type A sorting domain-containing protein [Candidatus Eisenbacteria bacterium]
MKTVLAISLALLVVTLSAASSVGAREIERKVPMLDVPGSRVTGPGRVASGIDARAPQEGSLFGITQAMADTFYYGGTVWDAVDGQWEAAEPGSPGWANRKMWTWSPGGFGGTPHSGQNMDGWLGADKSTDEADNFNVEDSTTIGACATSKVLFCGLTNAECYNACYTDLNGTGYGNDWNQMVVTPVYSYTGTEQIQLTYDYYNETEPSYDYTYVKLQVYDTVNSTWLDFQTLATYEGLLSGTGNHDIDSYLLGSGYSQWRILFQFWSDGGFSDEDPWYPTNCGACWFDNYALSGDVTDSEDFEAVELGTLPAGWSKYVSGCGDFSRAEHIDNVTVPLTLDPCVSAVPGWCTLADSVLVFDDPSEPGYPHPLCQNNPVVSPVIDLSSHPGLPGRVLFVERFANLRLYDYIFMYWQVRYKPGCAAGGWSPWLTDSYVYYSREGPSCATWVIDLSAYVPPDAQYAQAALAVLNYCDWDPWGHCTYVCNASPYYDNVTFGLYGSDAAPYISMRELDYWQDQFSEDGTLGASSTADTRIPLYLSNLIPPIFGDTLVCRGSADNMEVHFVFSMAKEGPAQSTTHDFFTTWFPGVTAGGWYEARMDTAEVTEASGFTTVAAPQWWACSFHEDDPVRIANALSECTEILPNNVFVPGTRIEYFLKSRYSGSSDYFFLPDTTGGACEEFEILPMMRDAAGAPEWPCLIVVDHFGQRGNRGERNSDRIAHHLTALGYDFDVFNKLGPASDLRNGIGRWAANTGQVGGPGTDKYNWGPGATLIQFVGYRYCILNTGDVYGYSIYKQDTDMLTSWLLYLTSPFAYRFLWLSGDQVCRELNRRVPWGPEFLNNVLCASYVASTYSSFTGDYTYCLPMDGIAGGRIFGESAESYVTRSNGCPTKLSVVGVSAGPGCNAAPEVEYNSGFAGDAEIAAVSNDRTPCVTYYRTFTEGYDFCLIRTDDSQGLLECGTDDFLSAWLDSVLTWGGANPAWECGLNSIIYLPPDPEHSTVEWLDPVCDSSKVFVCPGSYDVWFEDTCRTSSLYVCVRNMYDMVLRNAEVCAFFDNPTCELSQCEPVVGYTDDNGVVILPVWAGLNISGDTACCSVRTTVKCTDVTLYSDTLQWLSPDLNGDGGVSVEDSLIFVADWASAACRSDFNCDGIVDGLDLNIFGVHYWHACDPSLVSVRESPRAAPLRRELAQNYPNPFNPFTRIEFSLAKPARVVLRIYDIAGRAVRTLLDARREPGTYSEVWDGRTDDGRELPSGVYFCRLEAGDFVAARKVVLLK